MASVANRRSTCVRFFSYNAATEKLSITFVKGSTYIYSKVKAEEFERFKSARSLGEFFDTCIRDQHPAQLVIK